MEQSHFREGLLSARDSDRTLFHSHSNPTSDLTSASEKTQLAEVLCLGKVTWPAGNRAVDHTQGDPPNVCFMTSRVWVFSHPHSLARGQGCICFTPALLSAHTFCDNDSCHSRTAEFQMLKIKAQGFVLKSSQQFTNDCFRPSDGQLRNEEKGN